MIDTQIYAAINFYNKKIFKLIEFNNNKIQNLEINNEKDILSLLYVEFKRNNKIYKKNIHYYNKKNEIKLKK